MLAIFLLNTTLSKDFQTMQSDLPNLLTQPYYSPPAREHKKGARR